MGNLNCVPVNFLCPSLLAVEAVPGLLPTQFRRHFSNLHYPRLSTLVRVLLDKGTAVLSLWKYSNESLGTHAARVFCCRLARPGGGGGGRGLGERNPTLPRQVFHESSTHVFARDTTDAQDSSGRHIAGLLNHDVFKSGAAGTEVNKHYVQEVST